MGGVEQMETRDWLKQNRKSEHVQIWSWGIMLHGALGVQLEMSVDECEWVMGYD